MKQLHTSLLREKFVLYERNADNITRAPVVALSNRMEISTDGLENSKAKKIIVRTQNMHSCVRMAARIGQTLAERGPAFIDDPNYNWKQLWDSVISDYEFTTNPQCWVALYSEGKKIFSEGDHHLFLGVIEKCHAKNNNRYEEAVALAEAAFQRKGKEVKIEYDANFALTAHLEEDGGRVGVILRGPLRTATFNFFARPKKQKLRFQQCLWVAAAFLEGMQLAFTVGMNEEKAHKKQLERFAPEMKLVREGKQRLVQLTNEIDLLEESLDIKYRPERPEFKQIIEDSKKLV
ncbi:MAG: hypothetical protein IT558_05740 [Alphaproteobacteria bacterium]|nr:hypothetical protein [Alphaproteobacteria bacterium]